MTYSRPILGAITAALLSAVVFPGADAFAASVFTWQTVVNNADIVPGGETERFFSYNQPSVSDGGLVVFRARARDLVGGELLTAAAEGGGGGGGGEPIRGIFTRDMSTSGNPINQVAVNRTTLVPAPNNLNATFNEFPSFPRIDGNGTYAFRGQSRPVWEYTVNGTDTRVGTSGVYTNPAGSLITGASQLGAVPGFEYFAVPGAPAGTKFDQFPGAPSPTGSIVTFKGNWTSDAGGKTGIYFRDSIADAGASPVKKIAESGMDIPNNGGGSIPDVKFGSTAPPSAWGNKVVFTGLDNEEAPTAGGIYIAEIMDSPDLKPLVDFSTEVPGSGGLKLNRVGEALSFNGNKVGFWGAWGTETKTVTLTCGSEGNAAVINACIAQSDKDENGVPTGTTTREVPKNQGIFTVDVTTGEVELVAKTGDTGVDDLLFWNFSGAPPEEGGEGDREPPRWRSTAFVAVDGEKTVFKAASANGVDSLMIDYGATNPFETLLDTTMMASILDLMAPKDALIVELGVERDSFRNNWLAINASFLNAAGESWAGIYLTAVPLPAALPLFGTALAGIAMLGRRRTGKQQPVRS